MKTVGEAIRVARVKKRYSLDRLEKETKIKREFIEAIEEGNWDALPEFPVITGFVKNISEVLRLNPRQTVAFLRRDYPPKSLRINPKPDAENKFTWSPKFTFFVGIIIVLFFIFVYLGFQYVKFISPPFLEVLTPKDGEVVTQVKLLVTGATNPQAGVKVNNQPVLVDENGSFSTEVEIVKETGEIVVKATSRSGKETVVRRKIRPELQN